MMSQVLNFFSELFRRGADHVAAGFIGLLIGCIGCFWLLILRPKFNRRYQKLRDERDEANAKAEHSANTVDALTSELEESKSESNDLGRQVMHREQMIEQLRDRIAKLNGEIEGITETDGELWLRPPTAPVPQFEPLRTGRPPIISVVNLKGGVGKTTISANLGAAAMLRNRRVLFVDLDFQASLTSLCLPGSRIADMKARNRLVQEVLGTEYPDGRFAFELTERLDEQAAWILGTHENLAGVEMQAMVRWLAGGSKDDVRYRLRRALHSEEIADQFDLILLDCPPRLSTACINALSCCDSVLIPVILDELSAEAAPRMLRWLRKLKSESGVCPDFNVLGLVADKVYTVSGPSRRQREVWDSLEMRCKDAWQEPVYRFETTIPDWTEFAEAAQNNTFAALRGRANAKFRDLLDEIQNRMPAHEGRRPAIVSE